MPRDVRETLIQLDHDTGRAAIWTVSRSVVLRAVRCGFTVEKRQAGGTWLVGSLKQVLLRKVPVSPRVMPQGKPFQARVLLAEKLAGLAESCAEVAGGPVCAVPGAEVGEAGIRRRATAVRRRDRELALERARLARQPREPVGG